MNLQVNEIFTSLSGEPDAFGNKGGLATFVRLQGCNLHCIWCDTDYAIFDDDGSVWDIEAVLQECNTSHVIVTGGEPLLQRKAVTELVTRLVTLGKWVTIETNGTQEKLVLAPKVLKSHWRAPPVRYVMDYKLSSSGETHNMQDHIFDGLTCFDMIKFVIADYKDYDQARAVLEANPHWLARIVFSPIGICPPTSHIYDRDRYWPEQLARYMINDRLEFIQFSLQLHKLVNLK